ncbi:hypothetical protein B0A58_09125 [Flavobacterium branchiophilum NBRC 15030 = ATCC 35035]|nr:hypothetical protein B0A58_09125 [Flavobacterium branchiophilum NBRC 15030 = ATCC 35035]
MVLCKLLNFIFYLKYLQILKFYSFVFYKKQPTKAVGFLFKGNSIFFNTNPKGLINEKESSFME